MQGKYKEKYIVDNDVFEKQLATARTFMARILFGVKKKKNSAKAKEMNKKLRERFPDIEFSWTDIIIEMSPAGCTKSNSLNFYVEKTGFKKEDVYVVGDSGKAGSSTPSIASAISMLGTVSKISLISAAFFSLRAFNTLSSSLNSISSITP